PSKSVAKQICAPHRVTARSIGFALWVMTAQKIPSQTEQQGEVCAFGQDQPGRQRASLDEVTQTKGNEGRGVHDFPAGFATSNKSMQDQAGDETPGNSLGDIEPVINLRESEPLARRVSPPR